MATLTERLAELDRQIASATSSVQDGDKKIVKRPMEELLAARQALVSQIASAANPSRGTPRYQLADFRDD